MASSNEVGVARGIPGASAPTVAGSRQDSFSTAAKIIPREKIQQAAQKIASSAPAAPTQNSTADEPKTLASAREFVAWSGRLKAGQNSRAQLPAAYGFDKRTADVTRNDDGNYKVRVYNRALAPNQAPSNVNYYEFQAASAEEAARKLGLR